MSEQRTDRFNRVAVGIVSLALLVVIAVQAWSLAVDHRKDARRTEALDVAKAQVLDLTTLDSASIKTKITSMSRRVTGDFKKQFDGFSKVFTAAVTKDKLKATGTIKAAALSSYSDSSATAIVAASAKVSTGGKAAATPRDYRLKVDLSRIGGAWLISGMEFVQ